MRSRRAATVTRATRRGHVDALRRGDARAAEGAELYASMLDEDEQSLGRGQLVRVAAINNPGGDLLSHRVSPAVPPWRS